MPLTDNSSVSFDPLVTNSYANGDFAGDSGAGGEPDSLGVASFTVIPEPGTASLLPLAPLYLGHRRQRKASAFSLPSAKVCP